MEDYFQNICDPHRLTVTKYPGWETTLLESCLTEGEILHRSRIIKRRGFIFKLCEDLGYIERGIPGQTCQIMEQYLNSVIEEATRIEDGVLRVQYCMKKVVARVLLITACCMQIATKISRNGPTMEDSQVQSIMCRYERSVTIKQIKDTYNEIFSTTGLDFPMHNSVQITGMLITEVSDDTKDLREACRLMQLTEYNRYTIEMELHSNADFEDVINNKRVRTLHLAAGCAVAAIQYKRHTQDPVLILASLVQIPSLYLLGISEVIIKACILHNESEEETNDSLKRKRDSQEPEASTSKRNHQ